MATSIARASRAASGGSRSASPAGRSPRWSLSLAVIWPVDASYSSPPLGGWASLGGLHLRGVGRDRLHVAAETLLEGRGVDFLELDLAVQHLLLPLQQLGMRRLEFRHDLLG